MMVSSYKRFKILFLLYIFTPLLCTETTSHNPTIDNSIHLTCDTGISHQQVFDHYGIRASQYNHYNYYTRDYNYAHYSADDFRRLFHNGLNGYKVLSKYELYAFPNFCAYARTLPCYQEFMLSLNEKINNDKSFRKKTAYVKGFHYSFSLWKEKSEFHDFVHDEVGKLQTQQGKSGNRQGGLCLNDQSLDVVIKDCITRLQINSDNHRLTERIKAINDTHKQQGKCFDYSSQVVRFRADDFYAKEFSNTYGTQLDCQLHKELYDSRNVMLQLERTFLYNQHIQAIAPFVHYYAAQAKMEKNPWTAFTLSDFCYAITQFLTHGMSILYDGSCAIGKGAWKGAQEFVNPERFCDTVTGALHMGLLFVDAMGQVEELNNAADVAIATRDHDVMLLAEEKYRLPAQERMHLLRECSQQTYQKIRVMPWQDIVEHGAEIGTTMILDIIAVNALNGVRTSFVKNLTTAIESGTLLSEQYAVEVAGFGKLIVEEGAEVSVKLAADVVKNDLVLFAKNAEPISQQIKNKVTQVKWSENTAQKIRNVGDDILDVMEQAGGHTLERHVGHTYNELLTRSLNAKAEAITTFTNKQIAVKAVKEVLRNNAEKVALWLSNPLKNQMVLEFSHLHSIGMGVFKGKKNPFYNLMNSRIVLEIDLSCELGFKILTAFPIII